MEESQQGKIQNKFDRTLVTIGAVGISLFIIFTTLLVPLTAMIQRAAVLGLSFMVIFLQYPILKKSNNIVLRIINYAWTALAVFIGGYVFFGFESLVTRIGSPNQLDLILGGLIVIMVLDATRRAIGWPLPIVATLFLLYTYFGDMIPGMFGHRGYSIVRIINQMFMTTEGVFGVPLGVVVTIVFLFVLFGSFLEKSGAGAFFINFAVSIAGRARGGPAKIAVVGSGLMGMISGSSIANVASVGSLTIPLMKKVGYRPEFAAAVEAAASTGGQIMPPIMGAGAFIMSEFTQTPYMVIIGAAAIPALMYYFSLFMNVHFEALRTGMKGLPEEDIPKIKEVFKIGWVYVVPIAALIVTLMMGFSPARAAFIGIALLIVVSMLRASTRMKAKDYFEALRDAGQGAVSVAAACATAGIIVGSVSMTGLGIKFSSLIGTMAGGKELIALILTALAGVILGMALPTTANYIVQASVAAPALVAMGIPMLTAHMFVFYFGVFADITPPVALAAYTAAGIAKGDPMKAGLIASKNVMVAYLIPFLFVFFPALMANAPVLDIILTTGAALLGVVAMSAAWSNFLLQKCNPLERLLLVASAVLLVYPEYATSAAGLVLLALLYFRQRLSSKKNLAAGA
ncbi:TRAP transporter permease [Paradesulfitobacterium ferrireducens]|uniref:TRAP transporter permease n=1 Tax=Paradesulfitobacterium ferrireducens TaxID=2816476 RepID=UPI001A905CAA|nr:TRAP transporter permease [Paradesulfitobacterium ferrireducens]